MKTIKDIVENVYRVAREHFGESISGHEIPVNAELMAYLGADTLDIIEFIMAIEMTFTICITEQESRNLLTLADIITLVACKAGFNAETTKREIAELCKDIPITKTIINECSSLRNTDVRGLSKFMQDQPESASVYIASMQNGSVKLRPITTGYTYNGTSIILVDDSTVTREHIEQLFGNTNKE